MVRLASFSILAAFVFLLPAGAQIPNTGIPASNSGIPASVVSPTANGQQHGIPASVVSPKPSIQGVRRPTHGVAGSRRPLRPFGTPGRRLVLVPVPLFYPAYGQTYDAQTAVADPADPGTVDNDATPAGEDSEAGGVGDQEELRKAYMQGARDALARQASRYGTHYLDSRENSRPNTLASSKPVPAAPVAEPEPDNSPGTVFVFKDGHQIETRNFAIMGQTLYDFSSSSLKKVQLSDLDTAATQKANDDRGIVVKLP